MKNYFQRVANPMRAVRQVCISLKAGQKELQLVFAPYRHSHVRADTTHYNQ
jgi:hypothetical protein